MTVMDSAMVQRRDGDVVSRHTVADAYRWLVRAENDNARCDLPRGLFESSSFCPNPLGEAAVRVRFEASEKLPADRLNVLLRCTGDQPHRNTIKVMIRALDEHGAHVSEAGALLRFADEVMLAVALDDSTAPSIIEFVVQLEACPDADVLGGVEMRYAVAFRRNALDDLLNRMGSDKGTVVSVGRSAVPHCYSMAYWDMFAAWRDDDFAMLEIGLQSRHDEPPSDAPSLRAWREFFPGAEIFGFDLDDFSFFEQDRTRVFRGDQSAREDWHRLLASMDRPFRLIIDDGSHASSHQQISLACLIGAVEPGGLYVVEDLHWQPFEEPVTTLEALTALRDEGEMPSPHLSPFERSGIASSVDRVHVRRPNDSELAFLRKAVR